jgi:hypothetical protein
LLTLTALRLLLGPAVKARLPASEREESDIFCSRTVSAMPSSLVWCVSEPTRQQTLE